MNLKYPILNTLKESSIEFGLKHISHRPPLINPDWNLSREELKDVRIRWTNKYEWDPAADWVEILLYGFRQYVKVDIVDDIPQNYKGTVIFQIEINGKSRDIAIGYSDYTPINEYCAKQCDLYFKMQFDRQGYRFKNVVPGGYVSDAKKLYFYLNNLRKLRSKKSYLYDVYGRFGLDYSREIRERAVKILSEQQNFLFQGGMKKKSYSDFLKEIAHSKICLDLPGLGSFCFRLINYLAIGSCVIAFPHDTILQVPLIDRKHIIYCKEDFSDLVELCQYYLDNEDEREMIAENARKFFDLYLHKDSLIKYYLRTCLDRFQ